MGSPSSCPHCLRPFDMTPDLYDQALLCPWCGRQFVIPDPNAIRIQAAPASPVVTAKRRKGGTINRLMLLATMAWLLVIAFTGVWLLLSSSAELEVALKLRQGGEYFLGWMMAFLMFAGLETLPYAMVMIFLWVLRENVRE